MPPACSLRSPTPRPVEWVYGYKLHLLLGLDTGEVLALSVTPAHRHDHPVGLALVRGMKRMEGAKPSLLLADSAYDAEGFFQAAEGKGRWLLSGYNRRRGGAQGEEEEEQLAAASAWGLPSAVPTEVGTGDGSPLGLEACVRRVRGLKAAVRQAMAVVTAFSFAAQALARNDLPITWVAMGAA